jgi:hypothetical protein
VDYDSTRRGESIYDPKTGDLIRPPVYTATKSACLDANNQSSIDMIFLLTNDFITQYLPRKCNTFDKKVAIELTRHLCMWLSHRGFSKYKISLSPSA